MVNETIKLSRKDGGGWGGRVKIHPQLRSRSRYTQTNTHTLDLMQCLSVIAWLGHVADSPRLRQTREFEHFHSVSWSGTLPSSDTTGTHPPNEKILFLMSTAVCRLRGRGVGPCIVTEDQRFFSEKRKRERERARNVILWVSLTF